MSRLIDDQFPPGSTVVIEEAPPDTDWKAGQTFKVAELYHFVIGRHETIKEFMDNQMSFAQRQQALWLLMPAGGACHIDSRYCTLLTGTRPVSSGEPPCTCDIKALVSVGCTCAYAKWKRGKK